MGLFSFLKSRPRVDAIRIPSIVDAIERRCGATREQFVFAAVTTLNAEGCDLPDAAKVLQEGSEVDSALRGYQLACVVGFAWRYMELDLTSQFDNALTRCFADVDASTVSQYRERYLDCEGNVEQLTARLASDLVRLWGRPRPSPTMLRGVAAGAKSLAMISQAHAADAAGDSTTAQTLRRMAGS